MLTWDAVSKRLTAHLRDKPAEALAPQLWLAKQIDVSKQAVTNWVARGEVPADKWLAIARVLHCGLDELLGLEPLKSWPFETVPKAQWDALSERQKGAVEAAALEAIHRTQAASGKQDRSAA